MKTEDLQKQGLTQEQINFVMAENGKDLKALQTENAKLTTDRDTWKDRAETAEKTLKGFEGKDFDAITKERDEWQRKHKELEESHKLEAEEREFKAVLETEITNAKGKNAKAITALLDLDALRSSRNQQADIKSALDSLRTESGYLFEDNGGAPRFTQPNSNGGFGGTLTKKEILAIRNPGERQAKIAENIHLFQKG